MGTTIFLLPLLASVGQGFFFRNQHQNWNNLKVKWSINVFSPYTFAAMPRLEQDAHSHGFVKISDCNASSPFAGKRYVKDNDHAVVLLYDVNGYIAGIQLGRPKASAGNQPYRKQIGHPFVDNGDHYYLTAYFTNPDIICTSGRTRHQWNTDGTGDSLYIQNGTTPRDVIRIPDTEVAMSTTRWVRGECFYTMGMHYWYDVSLNMSCEDFFPVFILYNNGKLNAFGWALGADMTSPRIEHPPHSAIGQFMTPTPRCLLNEWTLSTMHIYFTDHPRFNFC